MTIKNKLFLITVSPVIILLFFLLNYTFDKNQLIKHHSNLIKSADIMKTTSNLLHEFQYERGLSSALLTTKDKYFNKLLLNQQQKSDINKRSKELCAILPQQIKQAYNRKDYTNMYYCKSEKVYGVNTISYSFDGAIYGTRSYGYYFNTKEATITLTITCKNSKCNEVKKDADLIFKKLELL